MGGLVTVEQLDRSVWVITFEVLLILLPLYVVTSCAHGIVHTEVPRVHYVLMVSRIVSALLSVFAHKVVPKSLLVFSIQPDSLLVDLAVRAEAMLGKVADRVVAGVCVGSLCNMPAHTLLVLWLNESIWDKRICFGGYKLALSPLASFNAFVLRTKHVSVRVTLKLLRGFRVSLFDIQLKLLGMHI